MFSWLKRLIRQALSFRLARGRSVQAGLLSISAVARRFPPWRRGPDRPLGDSRIGVREPKPDRPCNRSGAIAVVEPDEPEMLSAVARPAGGAHNTSAH
jgi:hypothetical protein